MYATRRTAHTLSWVRERKKAAEIEAELKNMGETDSLSSYPQKVRAMERCADEEKTAELAVSALDGELSGLRKRLLESKAELNREEFKDIEVRFRKQQVELKTLEMGNRDLDRYCKGLEKALLAYHSSKMESINQSLKELWQTTYQGQDIDYIQIKADSVESGRSSYDYRVIMYSAGAEMNMRGRCSAGQKVLACILIRMALAETFSSNCGVIALDEPTTNLDAANSRALAQALRRIIQLRNTYAEGQRAFQLIVITHDEKFATMLGTREYAEYMTRVTKDANQYSCLTRVRVMAE